LDWLAKEVAMKRKALFGEQRAWLEVRCQSSWESGSSLANPAEKQQAGRLDLPHLQYPEEAKFHPGVWRD
jgi:hypothetical protein